MTTPLRLRVLDVLLLATIFVTTWHKIHWEAAGQVTLEDLFALAFLGLFAADRVVRRDWKLHPAAASLIVVLLLLEAVFLLGYFNLETPEAFTQYAKGMAKYLIHFAFLICGVAHVVRRGRRYLGHVVAALVLGIVANAAYGVCQLVAKALLNVNLDQVVIGPITFGQGSVGGLNVYGAVSGVSRLGAASSSGVFRVNALALDPNHLGIMLCVPILIVLPFALREGVRTRRGLVLAGIVAFCLVVELLTLSRSGLFGLAVGLLVLAIPFRRQLFSPRLLAAVAAVFVVLAIAVASSPYASEVFRSRFTVSDRSAQVHYEIFALVPPVLDMHPLLGLGLNTFSVYYEFETGRTDWGPHSYYVALIAETGLIGTAAFAAFLLWLVVRLAVLYRAAHDLEEDGDPEAARAGPLAHGLTAAFAATLVANVFYLTMQFYYFYALVLVIVAAAALYATRPAPVPVTRAAAQPA